MLQVLRDFKHFNNYEELLRKVEIDHTRKLGLLKIWKKVLKKKDLKRFDRCVNAVCALLIAIKTLWARRVDADNT